MASVIFECRECHHVWSDGPVYGAKCPECKSYGPIVDWDEQFNFAGEAYDATEDYTDFDSEDLSDN